MFSGKTSELVRRVQRYKLAGYNCVIVSYLRDTRISVNNIASHDGIRVPAIPATTLAEVRDAIIDYDVVGIDEGHFFPDIVGFCEGACDLGKKVIVAGLDGDFRKQKFGEILNLIPLAESVTKLSAICMSCAKEAAFTKRICDDVKSM